MTNVSKKKNRSSKLRDIIFDSETIKRDFTISFYGLVTIQYSCFWLESDAIISNVIMDYFKTDSNGFYKYKNNKPKRVRKMISRDGHPHQPKTYLSI